MRSLMTVKSPLRRSKRILSENEKRVCELMRVARFYEWLRYRVLYIATSGDFLVKKHHWRFSDFPISRLLLPQSDFQGKKIYYDFVLERKNRATRRLLTLLLTAILLAPNVVICPELDSRRNAAFVVSRERIQARPRRLCKLIRAKQIKIKTIVVLHIRLFGWDLIHFGGNMALYFW